MKQMFSKVWQNLQKNIFRQRCSIFNKAVGWKPKTVGSSQWRRSEKKLFLKSLQISQENTCVEVSFK